MNAIEAIVVCYKEEDFKFGEFLEVLSKMSNLRLMIINQTDDFSFPNDQSLLDVPNQLRHLSWHYCPAKCLSFSSQPVELVHLELRYSKLEYLWEGVMVILFFNLFIISLFFKCSYKYKYTPGVFELPPFIYKAVLI